MSQLMDLLRGPALGVIVMIILMAGVLIITAFAALIAQMSLLLRLRPWNTSEKRSETGKEGYPQETFEQRSATREDQRASSPIASVHHRNIPTGDRWWLSNQIRMRWLMQSSGKQ